MTLGGSSSHAALVSQVDWLFATAVTAVNSLAFGFAMNGFSTSMTAVSPVISLAVAYSTSRKERSDSSLGKPATRIRIFLAVFFVVSAFLNMARIGIFLPAFLVHRMSTFLVSIDFYLPLLCGMAVPVRTHLSVTCLIGASQKE